MPIRPTVGGFQAPQWLLDTIRTLELSIRRLDEAVNSLRRGESLNPASRTQDGTNGGAPGANSGGGGVNSNNSLSVGTNNNPMTTNVKQLNFIAGTGASISHEVVPTTGKFTVRTTNTRPVPDLKVEGTEMPRLYDSVNFTSPNDSIALTTSGENTGDLSIQADTVWVPQAVYVDGVLKNNNRSDVDVKFEAGVGINLTGTYNAGAGTCTIGISADNIPSVVSADMLTHYATSDTAITSTYAAVTPLTTTIPANPIFFGGGYRLCRFDAYILIKNNSATANRDIDLKISCLTDTIGVANRIYVDYMWGSGHNESGWYHPSLSLSSPGTAVTVTGIPAGAGFPFTPEPGYLTLVVHGTTQYHTEHDTDIIFYVKSTHANLSIVAESSVIVTPLG